MMIDICRTFLESGQFPEDNVLNVYKPDGVTADPLQLASGLFAFQLALTTNMVNTAQAAIGQIDVCLKMARFFQFHLRHIEDAYVEQARNTESLSVFTQVKEQALHSAQGSLGVSMQIFKGLGIGSDSEVFAKLRAVGDSINDTAIIAEKNKSLAAVYLKIASPQNYNIFPDEYRDEPWSLNETIYDRGLSLTAEFREGQSRLINAVNDHLGRMMARIKHIREVVIPAAISVTDTWSEDIEYNLGFIRALIGWQEIFSQISKNNDEFTERMTPQLP